MNTEFIVHPRLQHYGLTTSNLDAMVDWSRKVLGMSTQHRAEVPAIAVGRAPFLGAAFTGNAETSSTTFNDALAYGGLTMTSVRLGA